MGRDRGKVRVRDMVTVRVRLGSRLGLWLWSELQVRLGG